MANLGFLALLMALIVSVYSLLGYIFAIRSKNERILAGARGGVAATAFLITVSSLVLFYLLLTGDFSVKYVADYCSLDLPTFYKLSGFWAGNAGSLLLWALVLSIYTVIIIFSKKHQSDGMFHRAAVILLVNIIFFVCSMIFFANPFEKNPIIPVDGRGLNPQLRNPWMVIHPVTLYLGYVGMAVPFAFAMGALVLGRADSDWIKLTRRWTVVSWLFLGLGNLFGAQWAYVELGWGGYWAWDPVENASFLPWLTSTAFLHSVMVQERKGMMKIWNLILIIISYGLTLYGTFLVRSGVLSSVHAFPRSNLGYWFGFFMFFILLWAFYLVISRRKILESKNRFEALVSKESSFLLSNVLFIGSAFIIFWGTNLPLFSGLLTGVKRTVDKTWFNSTAGPILLAIIVLMGICPLVAWQKSTLAHIRKQFLLPLITSVIFGGLLYGFGVRGIWGLISFVSVFFVLFATLTEFIKGTIVRSKMTGEGFLTALGRLISGNRRRYGGYIVHIGLFLMALGVAGESFYSVETIKAVNVGEEIKIGRINDYRLTFNGVKAEMSGNNEVVYADLQVTQNGRPAGIIRPEKIYYPNWENPRTQVVIKGSLTEDLYVMLAGWSNKGMEGTFEVHVNPLINWLWIGGYFLLLGTVFALWPYREKTVKS